jgi:hypothetical protein
MAAVAVLSSCGGSTSPNDRLDELDHIYAVGQQVRKQLAEHGMVVSDASCAGMYTSTGNDKYEDTNQGFSSPPPKGFMDQRRAFFINGCMNRPKSGTLPSAANTTPSPSPSTTGKP